MTVGKEISENSNTKKARTLNGVFCFAYQPLVFIVFSVRTLAWRLAFLRCAQITRRLRKICRRILFIIVIS